VSDHGYLIRQIQSLLMNDGAGGTIDTELYFPLLLVKDFNESGFKTSEEFMTNADVPVMAMDELIDQPRNPFTGKLITDKEKYAHDQFIIMSTEWEVDKHTDNHYLPAEWASVKDNRWDAANWNFYVGDEIVLTEHKLP
ncbi:MAG: hypothetical protein IIV43_06070, partial [Oscillospiraceae bacterium]|nr:hypothetical protein [Oscillospiraceae bacterium]